jgi:hypothetical protein
LDIVEGSAPSETKKEFAYEAGAGNVEIPASTSWEREREREKKREREKGKQFLDDCDASGSTGTLAVNRSGRSGLKEGAVVALENIHRKKRRPITEDVTSRDLRGKEW